MLRRYALPTLAFLGRNAVLGSCISPEYRPCRLMFIVSRTNSSFESSFLQHILVKTIISLNIHVDGSQVLVLDALPDMRSASAAVVGPSQIVEMLYRGNPFPAPPPADWVSPPVGLTTGPLAPGCLRRARSTGSSCLAADTPPALTAAPPLPLEVAAVPEASPGPRLISSSSPRSRHAGSFLVCVARWMPNAAC
jgi:hypothetical protein